MGEKIFSADWIGLKGILRRLEMYGFIEGGNSCTIVGGRACLKRRNDIMLHPHIIVLEGHYCGPFFCPRVCVFSVVA
ncbi:MAG: hypothetical protein H5T50_10570 [Nitrososphaeria archaeon]|nr:hypothetical protein [Nitrososphaeria archaeon]